MLVSQGQRKKIETGRGGSLWKLFSENTKTFLNVILRDVQDDSRFSQPDVGRYGLLIKENL